MKVPEKNILTPSHIEFCSRYLSIKDVRMAAFLSGHRLLLDPGSSYFVYLLCNPFNNNIFYVGKGKDKRPYHHLRKSESCARTNIKKHSLIREIQRCGEEPLIIYFETNLSENEAYILERQLIKKIGRANLTNIQGGIIKQDPADWAKYQLTRIKKLSDYCAENRSADDVELFLMIVSEIKKMAA